MTFSWGGVILWVCRLLVGAINSKYLNTVWFILPNKMFYTLQSLLHIFWEAFENSLSVFQKCRTSAKCFNSMGDSYQSLIPIILISIAIDVVCSSDGLGSIHCFKENLQQDWYMYYVRKNKRYGHAEYNLCVLQISPHWNLNNILLLKNLLSAKTYILI